MEQEGYAQQRYFGMVRALAHRKFAGGDGRGNAIALLQEIRERGVNAVLGENLRQQ